ncbi:hypothetical protein ABPG75_012398 [Micractinium tetrahymenae]
MSSMWSRLLWGWGATAAQPSSRSATPLYSGQEVESALQMAALSLALKNQAIDSLHEQLEAATARLAALDQQQQASAALATGAAQAAEAAQLEARCQSAGQHIAALTAQLADARAVAVRRARDIEAAHERSAAVKRQLSTVKAELAEAKAAQGSAVAALAELEAALTELRDESTCLRREKEQLQAMLTARESAYLTLLETVQDLFHQHSPSSSGEQTPAEDEGQQGDLGERLQHKLQEWQQRLQSAAKLRSLSRGGSEAIEAAASTPWSQSTTAAAAGASTTPACRPGSVCSSTASGGPCVGRTASPASSGSSLSAAQASAVQAAIEAAAHDEGGSSGGGSASSSGTAVEGALAALEEVCSQPALAQAQAKMPASTGCLKEAATGLVAGSSSNPRIPAARLVADAATVLAAVGQGQAGAAVRAAPAVGSMASLAYQGSRIKQLGLQAAGAKEGPKLPLPRPLLRRAVSTRPAAAAAAAPAAAQAWTPAKQPSKPLRQPSGTIGTSKAGLARVRSSGNPSNAAPIGASLMRRQSSALAEPATSAADVGNSPAPSTSGPPAGLAPLMLALAAAAPSPAPESAASAGYTGR